MGVLSINANAHTGAEHIIVVGSFFVNNAREVFPAGQTTAVATLTVAGYAQLREKLRYLARGQEISLN